MLHRKIREKHSKLIALKEIKDRLRQIEVSDLESFVLSLLSKLTY